MIAQGIDVNKALDCAEAVFNAYLPGYTLGVGNTNSPFRQDKFPSFSIKYKNNRWKFIDFGNSEYKGDVIDFIRLLYGLSFNEAVIKINNDFNSGSGVKTLVTNKQTVIKKKDSKPLELDIKSRPYTSSDLLFWNSFGITRPTLDFYKVKPISHYFINKFPILCKEATYAFEENKDGIKKYKIYCPEAKDPKNKWLNAQDSSVLQGWEQLPLRGDLLIVSKSRKDIMLLYELNYSAIGPASETNFIKPNVLKQLQERFKRIVVFYDNDIPGLREGKKWSEKFQLENIYIPLEHNLKDITDFRKAKKEELTKQLLKQLLNE